MSSHACSPFLYFLAGPVPQKAGHLPILLGKVHMGRFLRSRAAKHPRATRKIYNIATSRDQAAVVFLIRIGKQIILKPKCGNFSKFASRSI